MAEKYTELVQTRLTVEQNAILEKLAQAEGLAVASYVRRIIIKELNFAMHGVDGWIVEDAPESGPPRARIS